MSNHHTWDGKPESLWEYEAFQWALQRTSDQSPTANGQLRTIIAEKVREATERGLKKIDKSVIKLVTEGEDDDPDIVFVETNMADDGTLAKISK